MSATPASDRAWFPGLAERQVRVYLLGQGLSMLGTWTLDITRWHAATTRSTTRRCGRPECSWRATAGTGMTVSSPFQLEGEDKVRPGPSPAVGQHSVEVLREAGWTEAEIGRLRVSGAVA